MSVWRMWMKAGGWMRTCVFLVMDSLSPVILMLTDATVVDGTSGTCHEKHAKKAVLLLGGGASGAGPTSWEVLLE